MEKSSSKFQILSPNPNIQPFSNMLSLPVKVADHSHFSIIFFILGFLFTCWLFIYIITYKKSDRKISREILLALFSSIYLGLGSFFLILSLGVNV